MKKRGAIVSISGMVMIVASLSIAISTVPSNISSPNDFSVSTLFEGVFDEISNEIQIMPGDSTFVSYSTLKSDIPLLWGIQIMDFQPGDELLIKISNIFGDDYGEFVQDEPILFEALEIKQSDTLNLEIQNVGSRDVTIMAMFSEDPENSDALTNPNSPVMNMVLPLMISAILLILGITVSVVGVIVILVDYKNYQSNKRNY